MNRAGPTRTFYGWWVVVAAFLNLFFAVGLVFYGLPVFYASLVHSLHFTRSQVAQGLFLGFVIIAPFVGFMGALIDRVGARRVLRVGILLVVLPLILMGWMTRLWQYYVLCIMEVAGYILAGPISNEVLVSNWFRAKRGRAMGYAYLGLGLGGVVAPRLAAHLIVWTGWRHAFQIVGIIILVVLLPVAQWLTRSAPQEMGLVPDGGATRSARRASCQPPYGGMGIGGSHLELLADRGGHHADHRRHRNHHPAVHPVSGRCGLLYREGIAGLQWAALRRLTGRVAVGYVADRFSKKNIMALFYLILAVAIPLLYLANKPAALWAFALVFGFAMGADYMLIPLVTAECFGLRALGRLLSLIIMADSLGQFLGPVLAGKVFEATHSYNLAWASITTAGILGAAAIYAVSPQRRPRT